MPEFLRLSPPAEALQTLLRALPDREPAAQNVDTALALGRVLAADVRAPHPLPEFPRSTVDGYAVRARDTFGASESMPGYLTLIGEVPMGAAPSFALTTGACAIIHTGGMLPDGADAVVMLEYTQCVGRGDLHGRPGAGTSPVPTSEIELSRAVAEGENVLRVGEDVAAEQIVLASGTRLRPAEIGGCMALGITQLRVASKSKIGIISSGDEVVPPEQNPRPGQVRDVNSYSLAALVTQAGGEPVLFGIVPDSLEAMQAAAARALTGCDALVVTAGSSASARDTTADAIASLGAPGVLVHGVNVRPGKPTILAVCGGKAVIGLPGNPVSALVIAGLFVVPVIEKLLGAKPKPRPSVLAKLTVNVPSQAGREDWVAVKLLVNGEWGIVNSEWGMGDRAARYLAEPVFGKSNMIFSLAAADGLVRIPPDATGVSAGEMVEVVLI
ncbi:MAG: molybdopterin molybdotransferase [Anaerolineaceae bacterium]|nr:MAG: molybdopterin molybdotransferase [Anaerolineaceae bacterium]